MRTAEHVVCHLWAAGDRLRIESHSNEKAYMVLLSSTIVTLLPITILITVFAKMLITVLITLFITILITILFTILSDRKQKLQTTICCQL